MANVTGGSLQPIYSRLASAPRSHPYTATTFGDWSMESGDMVTVSRGDNDYTSPVHSLVTTWRKGQQVTVSSGGAEKRESIANVSQRKYGGGSGGLRNGENSYYAIETSYNEMRAGLILSSSAAALYVDNKYTQMTAGLNLTSSSAALYVDNKYAQMTAGLRLTSSSAALYVDNKYNQMKAGLNLTSSSAALYVDNKYNQMKSGLQLTSSSATLYVDNKYAQMKSGLQLTSSSAALYVDNKYNQMKSGLQLTSSSAALYAGSAANAARVVAQINSSTGESEIKLSSDKVYIGTQKSTTVINGKVDVNDLTADIANIPVLTVQAVLLTGGLSSSTADMRTGGTVAGANLYLGSQNMDEAFVSASVSGNTLTLTKVNGGTVTFSKAITSWNTGWSSGLFTATALPQNQSVDSGGGLTVRSADARRDGNILYVPIYAGPNTYTGYDAWVNWKNLLNSHTNSVGGLTAYNTSATVELYYKSGEDSYRSAGKHYWYYRDTKMTPTTYYS